MDSIERKIVQELVTALGCVIPASDGYEPKTNLWNKYSAAKNLLAAAPQVVADERELPPPPEMASAADLAYVMQTPEDWDADYRSTWQKLQVEAHNKRQWRKYALELRALAAAPAQTSNPVEFDGIKTVPVQAQEPFMFGIMGPDGKAHIDENCVAGDKDSTALNIEVNCLNDSPDSGYSIVPLYRAPVQPVAVPDGDLVLVKRSAVEWMQKYKPVLCEKSGLSIIAAPAAQGEAKDTERLRWLAETGARISWSMDGEYCAVWLPDERDGTEPRPAEGYPLKCYDSWHRAIDAAIAAKAAS